MCRNIRTLFNYDPPSAPADIEAAATQYVRKISGYRKPQTGTEPPSIRRSPMSPKPQRPCSTRCRRPPRRAIAPPKSPKRARPQRQTLRDGISRLQPSAPALDYGGNSG